MSRIVGGLQWGLVLAGAAVTAWMAWRGTGIVAADLAVGRAQAPTVSAARRCELYAQALAWQPAIADHWRLRAECLAGEDPERALQLAREATRIDPYGSANWITVAMIEVQLNQLPQAHQALVTAERNNVGFGAYFHAAGLALVEGDLENFWQQMREAMRMVPLAQLDSVLAECLRAAGGDSTWPAQILPTTRPDVVANAIFYFLTQNDLPQAEQAWNRLQCPSYAAGPCLHAVNNLAAVLVQTATDAQGPEAKRLSELAVQVWNRGLRETASSLTPTAVGQVADGDFSRPWGGASFNWRDLGHAFIEPGQAGPEGKGQAVRIRFDGSEAEQEDLFREYVAVQPQRRYKISYEARREGTSSIRGVELAITGRAGAVVATIPARMASQWQTSTGSFEVPEGVYMIGLLFRYQRPFGQPLLRDNVLLAHVRMEAAR